MKIRFFVIAAIMIMGGTALAAQVTPLEDSMKKMEIDLKTLVLAVQAENVNDTHLPIIKRLQDFTFKSINMDPLMFDSLPQPEKDKARLIYRASMHKLYASTLEAEVSVINHDADELKEHLIDMSKMKKAGHKIFKPQD